MQANRIALYGFASCTYAYRMSYVSNPPPSMIKAGKYNGCWILRSLCSRTPQALQGVRADRGRWLEGAREQAHGLGRLAEAVVQLELSREGRLWAPTGDPATGSQPQPAPDYGALLQRLGDSARALAAAQQQVGLPSRSQAAAISRIML